MGDSNRLARAAEVVVAVVLTVMAVPLVLVTAALSLGFYRAWPFFSHDRVGLGGEPFRFVKVRTLPPRTNRYADKYSLAYGEVPRTMQVVRRLHLDELPQLVHVIAGRMTFVGPRPEMPALHEQLPDVFRLERTSVRPGLTCLWQISAHSVGLIGERPEYDRLYVQHRNTRLDLWILCRTVAKMAGGGTVHLHEVPKWTMKPITRPVPPSIGVPEPAAATAGARRSVGLVD